jgi:dTDP-4-amino-4,6-dideoxyglucose formyltransferase
MYNKILIISDNIYLCEQLKGLFSRYRSKNFLIQFSISPYSKERDFSDRLNETVLVYDLRNDNTIKEILNKYNLIISIHCKQFFPLAIVNSIKCINIHPGYNPINRGWYPQVFAIEQNLPVGATIHEIDEKLDHGNIIARALVNKEITDTSETLYNKIIKKEIELITEYLDSILKNTYKTIKPEDEGKLYLKKDFQKLCKLDLDEKLTMIQFINKIRALTHGEFNNAYFIDPETGNKIYISIKLQTEK